MLIVPIFALGQTAQPRRKHATEHIHSIGRRRKRQFARTLRPTRDQQIPIRKSLGSRNSNLGRRHHTSHRRQIRQGIDLFPASNPEHRSADQEQRQIRSNLSRDPQSFRPGQLFLQRPLQPQQRSHSIRRRPTQSALHRQPLLDVDHHAPTSLERRQSKLDNPLASIRLVPRHARIVTTNLNARSAPDRHANNIVQRDGLVHRAQLVKAISPKRTNPQAEIDLGERSNGHRHGRMILTRDDGKCGENFPPLA